MCLTLRPYRLGVRHASPVVLRDSCAGACVTRRDGACSCAVLNHAAAGGIANCIRAHAPTISVEEGHVPPVVWQWSASTPRTLCLSSCLVGGVGERTVRNWRRRDRLLRRK